MCCKCINRDFDYVEQLGRSGNKKAFERFLKEKIDKPETPMAHQLRADFILTFNEAAKIIS